MSEQVAIKVIQPGDRAEQLIACLDDHLREFGASISGSAAEGLWVKAPMIGDDDEARAFVRHQLYECGTDWQQHLEL